MMARMAEAMSRSSAGREGGGEMITAPRIALILGR